MLFRLGCESKSQLFPISSSNLRCLELTHSSTRTVLILIHSSTHPTLLCVQPSTHATQLFTESATHNPCYPVVYTALNPPYPVVYTVLNLTVYTFLNPWYLADFPFCSRFHGSMNIAASPWNEWKEWHDLCDPLIILSPIFSAMRSHVLWPNNLSPHLPPVLYPWMIARLNQHLTHISPSSPNSYCCLRKSAGQTSDAALQHGISQGMPLLLGDKVSLWSSDLSHGDQLAKDVCRHTKPSVSPTGPCNQTQTPHGAMIGSSSSGPWWCKVHLHSSSPSTVLSLEGTTNHSPACPHLSPHPYLLIWTSTTNTEETGPLSHISSALI